MPFPILGMLAMAGASVASALLNNRAQRKQQERLMKDQIKGQKEMGRFNQQLAMDTWEQTNYEAQRRQMQKAGLNVGLMYNGQGHGGTTQGGSAAGSVTGGQANDNPLGMGLQLGLQTMMQKAQIKNIEANTEKTKAETAKTAGVDTDAVNTAIVALKQSTQNAEMQNQIMEYEKAIKQIEANKANMTQDEIIAQTEIATQKLESETRSAKIKAQIDEATEQNIIKQAQLVNNEMTVKIESGKAGIEQTKASTEQTKQNTQNLKQDEIEKVLHNQLRANGIEPKDSAPMRIVSRVLSNAKTSLQEIQGKTKAIIAWLKGENGEQTEERFKQIWNE